MAEKFLASALTAAGVVVISVAGLLCAGRLPKFQVSGAIVDGGGAAATRSRPGGSA